MTAPTRSPSGGTPTLAFFGMEITEAEAVGLLNEALMVCTMLPGSEGNATQWATVKTRAERWQLRVAEMHMAPGRVHLVCPTCGQPRHDGGEVARVPNPPDADSPATPERPSVAAGERTTHCWVYCDEYARTGRCEHARPERPGSAINSSRTDSSLIVAAASSPGGDALREAAEIVRYILVQYDGSAQYGLTLDHDEVLAIRDALRAALATGGAP